MSLAFACVTLTMEAADPAFLKVTASSPQHADLSFGVSVSAYTPDGSQATNFHGPLSLMASVAGSALPLSGGTGLTFTNGLWSGVITIATNALAVTLRAETTNGAFGEMFPLNVLPLKLTQVPLLVEDMIWDSTRQRIFASVGSSVSVYSNSVVRIHPESGAIEAAIAVGRITTPTLLAYYNDGKLALSDNGQYLYVAYSNAAFVRRIDLVTSTAGPAFPVGTDLTGQPLGVADMEVLAGAPLSVAVVQARADIFRGITVFDNGVPRANVTPFGQQYNVLSPAPNSSLIYALGSAGFCRLTIDNAGISLQDGMAFPGGGWPPKLESEGGLCFVGSGAVIDPAVPVMLQKLNPPASSSLVAPDTARRRVCYIGNLGAHYSIQPQDLDSYLPLRPLNLPKSFDYVRSFLRCSTNRYAYSTSIGDLVLVQSPLLTPTAAPADVAVTQSVEPGPIIVGSNVVLTVTVTNSGPALASDVLLTDLLDANATLISASASQGIGPVVAGTKVSCNLGNLAAGASATLTLTLRPIMGGWLTNHVTVIANEADTNMANNVNLSAYFAGFNSTPNSVNAIRVATRDLAYATNMGRIYASVTANGMMVSNAVVPIDPLTGQFGSAVLSAIDPGLLAISGDSQLLYAGAGSNQTIWRIELPAGSPTLSFPVGVHPDPFNPVPYGVDDMEVLPGQPHALAISRRRAATATWSSVNVGIAVYDDGVARSLTTATVPEFDVLEFGPTASDLYAYNRPVTTFGARSFRRLSVTSGGVTLLDTDSSLLTNPSEDIRCEAGLIFTTAGSLIDPQTRTRLGTVGSLQTSSLVEPDPASGRVFYLIPTASASQWLLRAYDLRTMAPLGTMTITNIVGTPSRLIRWGDDGLAFRTSGERLYLIRTALVPGAPATDLAVNCTWNPNPAMVGSNFIFTVTATNRGPATATNVVVSLLLPTTFASVIATSAQGTCAISNQTAFCRSGSLTNGGSLSFNVQVRPTKVGTFRVFAGVLATNAEVQLADNALELAVPVNAAGKLNQADELALATRDLVFDKANGRLLASVAASGSLNNSIVTINPASGQAELMKEVSIDPGRLAVADDGSRLFVATVAGNAVSELDLISNVETSYVSLAASRVLQDMEVLPGSNTSLALSWQAGSPKSVEVYDAGVRRTSAPVDSGGGRILEFGDGPTELYANSSELSGAGRLRAFNVSPGGVSEFWWLPEVLAAGEDIRFDSDFLYTSRGKIFSLELRRLTATIPGISTDALVTPLRRSGRVFYLTRGTMWFLQAHDAHTLGLIGSVTVSNVLGTPSRLQQWSTNGFAFRTSSNQVFLLRTDLLPSAPPADLAVLVASSPPSAIVGSNLTFTITVTNHGPNTASNTVFTDALSPDVSFVTASSTRGVCTLSNRIVRCAIGQIAAGEHVTIQITVVPQTAGELLNLASVVSASVDPDHANNTSSGVFTPRLRLPPNSIGTIRLNAAGLIYHLGSNRLYASVSDLLSVWKNSIVEIDPRDGSVQPVLFANQPSKLALSSDGEFLYVATEGDVGVQCFHLPSRTTNSSFYVRDPAAPLDVYIRDLAVVPGDATRLAVATGPRSIFVSGHEVRLYTNGVAAPNAGQGSEIEFISSTTLFGYEPKVVPSQTYRMNVSANGLAITDTAGDLVIGQMEFDSGLLYTASGKIINPNTFAANGTFPVGGSLTAPAVAEQRVYFMGLTNGNSAWALHAADTATLLNRGTLILTNIQAAPSDLVRCGYDLLAWRTATNQVCLLRTGLVPPVAEADSDDDGQPDGWEVTYGLDILSALDATQDLDADGMNNLSEFRAGTNPTNSASVFRVLARDIGNLELTFQTVTGKLYRVESAPSPAGLWHIALDNIAGTGSNVSFTISYAPGPTNKFFRALIKP
jgi:uncharacterized repeat protein (TIGR01451 family)